MVRIIAAAVAILTLGRQASAEAAGGFVDRCAYQGANLTDGHWLGIYCRNKDTQIFGYNYTWIDLDYCLGNSAGNLISYSKGNFSGSCNNCTIAHDDSTLAMSCVCLDTNKQYRKSTLDLNTTIHDSNGCAGCFDHFGNKTWEGP
ncbi:hypothetical protein B0T17DRAFT_496277 [Bombardia bombarda]|uniref:Cyanovirin-N domain-containing protein n=1 Tax=Bombardia bombarda TaxID=252184 RepID=A0AA40BYX6_9PEZI|nr:hypothetical protein B0T17DRAFT_496277 [Bombardia bombarda]